MTKTPNPIDVHVGNRLRLRRLQLGMSQEKLGERMGLTFQQIQKYEKGTNRIGASRLFDLSQILNAPVQFFFEEALLKCSGNSPTEPVESEAEDRFWEYLSSREGLEFIRSFLKIRDAKVRRKLIEFVRTVADET